MAGSLGAARRIAATARAVRAIQFMAGIVALIASGYMGGLRRELKAARTRARSPGALSSVRPGTERARFLCPVQQPTDAAWTRPCLG